MKTVLLNIFDSNMVRNILRIDVFKVLLEDPAIGRVVLLVHPKKLELYRKEFASGKVTVDPYPPGKPSFAEEITWFVLRHTIRTKNVRAKINELFFTAKGSQVVRFLKYALVLFFFYASYIPPIDWLLRRITYLAHDQSVYLKLLDTYKPDLVFLPTIFGTNDIRLMKACRTKHIPTVGMIKSWDNLIGKDPFLIPPDRLIVHNAFVKGYATGMHGYAAEKVYISGIPQMDAYTDPSFVLSREEFFSKLGLDPSKKLLVYTAVGTAISYYEPDVVRTLADIINSNALPYPAQLLVRLHPAYPVVEAELKGIPGITVVRPGQQGVEGNPLRFDFEFQVEDERMLASTMRYADVVLQSGSTIAIDAACFDTPLVSVGFDGEKEVILERSAKRLLIKDHFKRILDTGGTRPVYSKQEAIDAITAYLNDRTLDREGRMRIVSEQCYKLDGKSGERIGRYIVGYLKELGG